MPQLRLLSCTLPQEIVLVQKFGIYTSIKRALYDLHHRGDTSFAKQKKESA